MGREATSRALSLRWQYGSLPRKPLITNRKVPALSHWSVRLYSGQSKRLVVVVLLLAEHSTDHAAHAHWLRWATAL